MTNHFTHPIIDKYVENNEFGKLLGIDFTITEPGICVYNVLVETKHSAVPNVAHGGFIAGLIVNA
jgi:acyl-coenzyme A thioesterase PaaI-like protein